MDSFYDFVSWYFEIALDGHIMGRRQTSRSQIQNGKWHAILRRHELFSYLASRMHRTHVTIHRHVKDKSDVMLIGCSLVDANGRSPWRSLLRQLVFILRELSPSRKILLRAQLKVETCYSEMYQGPFLLLTTVAINGSIQDTRNVK